MEFDADYIYHIYNRGNNRCRIFFNDENYLFFLKKIRKELSEYFNFLAYCLMPNHFHFLVQVKELKKIYSSDVYSSDDSKSSDELSKSSDELSKSSDELSRIYSIQISNRIAILLRSYTRAINIQEGRTGSLFQQKTKAKCLNESVKSGVNYVPACFHYIHQNPLNAGIVNRIENWKFSSFPDYAGFRKGTLCNKELAYELVNFDRENFIEQSYSIIDEKDARGIWV